MAMSRDSTRWCEQRSRVRCNVTNRGSRRVYRPRRASHQPQERARLDGALQRQSCRCRQYQTRGRGPRSSRGFGVARPASARQAQRVRRSRRPAACRSGVLLVPSSLARRLCARHRRHRDGASRPTLVEQIRRSNTCTCSNCTPVVNFCLPAEPQALGAWLHAESGLSLVAAHSTPILADTCCGSRLPHSHTHIFTHTCSTRRIMRIRSYPVLLGAGPHKGNVRAFPPPSGRGPIEWARADAPHLRRLLRKAHAASPRGVAHGRGPLAPSRAWALRARG